MSRRCQRAQTLVEVLVSLAVIAVILSMVTALYMQMFNHYSKTTSDIDAQAEARFAMGRVTQALRQAMTDPNQPPGPPVVSPTANNNPTPPVGNSVEFMEAQALPTDANYQNLTYQYVVVQTSATAPPGHFYPNLVIDDYNGDPNNGGTLTSETTVGRDVKAFNIYPVTQSIYDIQLTIAPPVGMSQNSTAGASASGFTLNSRVFISYYQ